MKITNSGFCTWLCILMIKWKDIKAGFVLYN